MSNSLNFGFFVFTCVVEELCIDEDSSAAKDDAMLFPFSSEELKKWFVGFDEFAYFLFEAVSESAGRSRSEFVCV